MYTKTLRHENPILISNYAFNSILFFCQTQTL